MDKTVSLDELEEEILAWTRQYARESGWELNPDEKQLRIVIMALARNRMKSGSRYCPCRLRSGVVEKDRALICPRIWHSGEVEHDGHCQCNLFYKRADPDKEKD